MEAVRQHGYALKFACEDLQRDKEVVMEAVRQDGCSLEFACEELQRDKEVMEAVRQHGRALQSACEDSQRDGGCHGSSRTAWLGAEICL